MRFAADSGTATAPVAPQVPAPATEIQTALLAFVRRQEEPTGVAAAVPSGNRPPTAVNDGGFTVAEDTVKTITAGQLVGNDTDPDAGDKGKLSVASVSGAANGTVVLNGDGSVKFTPAANYNGAASFTYKVKDAAGNVSANAATVSMTVTAVNDAPRGVADGPFTVTKNTPVTLTAAQLVGNDVDPDKVYGDKLSVNSVGGASNGKVKLNADGSVTFTPNANFTGEASFIYRVKDSTGATSVTATDAVVTLKVVNPSNRPPTAVNDGGFTVAEDTVKTITAGQLVGNDTDPDAGDKGKLSVASVSGAANGTVVLNGDGSVKFTPAANYNGAASFTYKVKDAAGNVSANAATVSMTVTAVNDAPRGVADGPFTVTKNTPVTLTAAQLVGNDVDPDKVYGDKLSIVSLGGGNHVSAVLNPDGSVTVTPEAGYVGAASFIYRVTDSTGATSVTATDAKVTLDVKAPAVQTLTVLEPVTDNYKDKFNAPDTVRENRTYLQIGAIQANGVTYTLTNPPPNGKIETGFTQLAVRGSDGSSGIVTLAPADPNVVASLRQDYVTAYHPKGSFGPLVVVNTEQLKTAPVKIDLVLTVKNAEVARVRLEYRFEPSIYNADESSLEYNGPGGKWYVAGVGAPLNWQTAGAP